MTSFDHRKYRPFTPIHNPNRRWPNNRIESAPQWCAVDLRDGNQALIEPMTVTQKQKMWALLVKLGFKEIEIGFPAASQPDYDFCRWLIEENQIPSDVTIQVLVQAREELIERTYEALCGAERAIVHVYNSTSPTQRTKVFNQNKAGIIDIARKGAQKVLEESRKHPNTQWRFQYSPESFSGTEVDFAVEICNAVVDVWKPTQDHKIILNLPATVESSTPNVFADQIELFCDHIQQRDSVIISVHTHNDRGCAVAAAELAVMAGADRVEGTLMGNGERTGNMDLVTMAMNLYSQGIDPNIHLQHADEIVRVVSECTQIATHPRHPWVGELVYTAFSGSHQDAIRKCMAVQKENSPWDVAYLPIDPKDLGRDYQSVIRVNSQSGKGGVAYILEQDYGLHLPRWMQIEASQVIQSQAETLSKEMSSTDIWEVIRKQFMPDTKHFNLSHYSVNRTQAGDALNVTIQDQEDAEQQWQGTGDGVIEALCNAIEQNTGHSIQVIHYDQHAIGEGSNANAVAFIQAKIAGQRVCGISKSRDTLSANIDAVLVCLHNALDN
ncbi:2-isopropylmalate synthase [Marinibactrum halimedae]|uniref:2-isopropylmalate synthase n=1 Tax=Marinibactrum halimedae TaxID=1444977 RepID=A0AA37T3C8_9GAMM|nr:2-isopropylmalate synthase [Marinibactrum halimedae]MCD9459344.1 2-isopropylmalate synthase [Marinibactrum halimedae]GLS25763.1 2-isopropylmalate synthase [Marinibactrum halimedae]